MNAPPDAPALEAMLAQAWSLMSQGARDRRGSAHTPSLATVDAHGLAQVRTVVLRHCDPDRRELLLHTDRRSPKWTELQAQPRCVLHVYDAAEKRQLRWTAVASLHADDARADTQWASTRAMSRITYGSPFAPGQPLPDPAQGSDSLADRTEHEQRRHFAVICLRLEALDVLHLRAAGHRRARFRWTADSGAVEAGWCMP